MTASLRPCPRYDLEDVQDPPCVESQGPRRKRLSPAQRAGDGPAADPDGPICASASLRKAACLQFVRGPVSAQRMDPAVRDITQKLLAYCQRNDWAGYDPYDALNSRLFQGIPFLDSRIPRLALTQLLKRSPLNLRPVLFIPKTHNPKAMALFLMAFLKLRRLGLLEDENLVHHMIEKLITLRSPWDPSNFANSSNSIDSTNRIDSTNPSNSNNAYWCWGYSFPWQTRTILVPRGAPNLVCTVFVANALLDAYEAYDDPELLSMALSAADYILDELYWTDGNSTSCFSYPLPSSRAKVHNANLLGAALLCRVSRLTGERRFLEPAFKVARYSAGQQHEDGSWSYGEHPTQRWIDNFHTGYNLCALHTIAREAVTQDFETHLRLGFRFYKDHFFREDGAPCYFHDRTYPIDIHSVAQSIITLLLFRDFHPASVQLARSVLSWAMSQMWDEQGFFHYQVHRRYRNRICFMRWSQAWMLLALATLLEQ